MKRYILILFLFFTLPLIIYSQETIEDINNKIKRIENHNGKYYNQKFSHTAGWNSAIKVINTLNSEKNTFNFKTIINIATINKRPNIVNALNGKVVTKYNPIKIANRFIIKSISGLKNDNNRVYFELTIKFYIDGISSRLCGTSIERTLSRRIYLNLAINPLSKKITVKPTLNLNYKANTCFSPDYKFRKQVQDFKNNFNKQVLEIQQNIIRKFTKTIYINDKIDNSNTKDIPQLKRTFYKKIYNIKNYNYDKFLKDQNKIHSTMKSELNYLINKRNSLINNKNKISKQNKSKINFIVDYLKVIENGLLKEGAFYKNTYYLNELIEVRKNDAFKLINNVSKIKYTKLYNRAIKRRDLINYFNTKNQNRITFLKKKEKNQFNVTFDKIPMSSNIFTRQYLRQVESAFKGNTFIGMNVFDNGFLVRTGITDTNYKNLKLINIHHSNIEQEFSTYHKNSNIISVVFLDKLSKWVITIVNKNNTLNNQIKSFFHKNVPSFEIKMKEMYNSGYYLKDFAFHNGEFISIFKKSKINNQDYYLISIDEYNYKEKAQLILNKRLQESIVERKLIYNPINNNIIVIGKKRTPFSFSKSYSNTDKLIIDIDKLTIYYPFLIDSKSKTISNK